MRIPPYVVTLLICALLVLNIADSFATTTMLAFGLGQEANPLMRVLLDVHPLVFLGFKTLIGPIVAIPLWICRERQVAAWGALFVVLLYAAINCLHLYGFLLTKGALLGT